MLRQIKPPALKAILLCLLSALALILSFPLANIELLAWFAFLPLFLALKGKTLGKAFLWSYLTGIIFWLGIIYWLAHVTVIGMLVLVLYLSLYFGVFGFLVTFLLRQAYPGLIFVPCLWVALEYIRSNLFTGFPWALLGYSQYRNLPIIQISDITGAWGVSFLVMSVNTLAYFIFNSSPGLRYRSLKKNLWVLLLIVVTLVYGYYRISYYRSSALRSDKTRGAIHVSVIQANIPQELKWDIRAKEFILDKYLELTLKAYQGGTDLIIWPESAIPAVVEEEPYYFEAVRDCIAKIKSPLLLGAVTNRLGAYFNSAILLSREGRVLNRYDKLHLVPFGEYIPFRKFVSFLDTFVPIGDFTAGKDYTVFQAPGFKEAPEKYFSVLICFEDLFPGLSRSFVARGADFLVNITNDAWFGDTSAPYQHLQASVFRAVENRVYLVRCANTGVSAFINAWGEMTSSVKDTSGRQTFVQGNIVQKIPASHKQLSFYCRYGDLFILLCFLISLYGIISHSK